MSIFSVSIERIAKIWAHPNADRLELAQLASMTYQFVIGKDMYHVGDLVVYFPIDSVLPDRIVNVLGLAGKLAGNNQNRVKTIRLRGVISQGLVALPKVVMPSPGSMQTIAEGQDVTELLGVTKYEPPILLSQEGALGRMPPMVSVYDIEGAERFTSEVERYFMDQPVMITEKIEGSHFSVSLYADGDVVVCRRRYSIPPEHAWYRLAEKQGILAKLPALKMATETQTDQALEVITLRGEVIGPGIQGNIYRASALTVYLFEIEANGEPLPVHQYLKLVEPFEHVPLLAVDITLREWLAGRTLADASNGYSVLMPTTRREGIVIRPIEEKRDERLGRVILKQRSPEYLAGSDL